MSKISKDELLDFVKKNIRQIHAKSAGETLESCRGSARAFSFTIALLAEHQGLEGFVEDFDRCLDEVVEEVSEEFLTKTAVIRNPSQVVGYETPEGCFFCLACSDDEIKAKPGARPVLLCGAQSWNHICDFCGDYLDGRVSKEGEGG